jgi:heparosan-N-sulfate-glucuronate 5-epimerase
MSAGRLAYYRRILQAYLGGGRSQLSFWHETPTLNERAFAPDSRAFYMTFREKAHYAGPFDEAGIPRLDYRGVIGPQYNPIAIAQYGLGCWNMDEEGASPPASGGSWRDRWLRIAGWMADHLEENPHGLPVWMHHFDWEYFRTLRAPWYSGLAQGQGLALLVRAWQATGERRFLAAADRAALSLFTPVDRGGTLFVDPDDRWWIEEYLTEPLTHILNGFMWALWGVRDYAAVPEATHRAQMQELWDQSLRTLEVVLPRFDTGYWSTYDLAPLWLRNVASPFYHKLHLVQLDVMHRLTGRSVFAETLARWRAYQASPFRRRRAWVQKVVFKLRHY